VNREDDFISLFGTTTIRFMFFPVIT